MEYCYDSSESKEGAPEGFSAIEISEFGAFADNDL